MTRRQAIGLCLRAASVVAASRLLAAPADSSVRAAEPESATVIGFSGADKLRVRSDAGQEYKVQYVGVRGPVGGSRYHEAASLFHGPLVIGKRVRLESDGKDEHQGYRLRHVFVDDAAVPLGVEIVRSGWGTAVPFPRSHRFRDFFLEAQLEAMAARAVLWAEDVFGPAEPWRLAGSGDTTYIPAHPALHAAFDALATIPTGQQVLALLVPAGPPYVTGDLSRLGAAGATTAIGYSVTITSRLLHEDVRTIAAVVGHEAVHAVDIVSEDLGLASHGCISWEERAFGYEARMWAEFFGPNGKTANVTPWDRSENEVLRFAQAGDLRNMVAYRLDYLQNCTGEIPGS
jgi:endonuclease YncB( thermonuclease family)